MTRIQVAIHERSEQALDPSQALDFVSDPAFGGIALFVGKVRDHNVGRQVTGISYDMFAPLALSTLQRITEAVDAEYGPQLRLHVSHAHGRLAIGDLAVLVAAGCAHREQAFAACRALIEAVKHSIPVWKQEHYVDGDSEWSEGASLQVPGSEQDPAPP